ncbi:unnamed protein product [Ceutorhynchus assimilis]|uniref:SIAH-type domain-containing protein n=1 Tax=Ceutorhynchus assimilis TaxID=467358 RepID=A0A9N9MM66_9CUCU|nr:unnamed protein product [Ceutorhynchus assimilis]
MFQVPETILNKLKCNLCDGYLNAQPVVVKDNQQICAKCYKILPAEEMEKCVREITFEALGSCLVFPCRYHLMGCEHRFVWNNENGHEAECKKRYFTIPDVASINNNKDASMSLIKSEISTFNNAGFNPEDLVYENIYSTIKSIRQCLSCNTQVTSSNKNLCLFGHISCNNCKQDMCVACVKNLDGNSRIACKNASKGCQELLYQSDVGFHRDNCEFNQIACPINKCDKKFMFNELMSHLRNNHADKIFVTNELMKNMSHKDQILVFICHDSIFKCLYYYYVTSVELLVVYLGPCVKAQEFSFEVTVEVNKKQLKKKLGCANWNNYMLASGVSFDKKELQNDQQEKLSKFALDLKILREN